MGVIQRQSIQSSILQYLGAVLGFANKIFLFTQFLTKEEVGLSNILVTNAMLLAQFAAIGFGTVTLRFFPYFQDRTRRHHDFLFWLLSLPTIGFALVSFLVWIFKGPICAYVAESPLIVEYFWYLLPLTLATLYFDLIDAYLRSLNKTVVPVLFREVIQRLLIAVSILVYAFGWVTFPQFVTLYVGLLCSVTFFIIVYARWLGHLEIRPRLSWRMRQLLRRIMIYGGFTLLGNMSTIILYNLDNLMIAHFEGMDAVGVYTTTFYVTGLILIPWKAIQKISAPQVALHWRDNDLSSMNGLYRRTSVLNYAVGLFLFISMTLLIDVLFAIMPQGYEEGRMVLLIIGATRVIDMLTGLNGYIMVTSKYYYVDLMMNLGLLALAYVLNVLMIPTYGIEGAALATGISLLVSNLFRIGFLWATFGLHPFTGALVSLSLAACAGYGVGYFVTTLVPGIIGSMAGFVAFVAVFVPIVWKIRAVPDLNNYAVTLLGRFSGSKTK